MENKTHKCLTGIPLIDGLMEKGMDINQLNNWNTNPMTTLLTLDLGLYA